jgi:hypothetical protein
VHHDENLLVLDNVGVEGLETNDRTLLQLALIDEVVGLCGDGLDGGYGMSKGHAVQRTSRQHALDEVFGVVEDDTETFLRVSATLVCHGFNLNALQDGFRDLVGC